MSFLRFLILLTACIGVHGASPDVDALFSRLVAPNSPGLAVLVRSGGRTVFRRGYGVRDLRTSAKINTRTNFRLASFTKQFTAMAVMLLVHDGKLRYDQPLTSLYPGFPDYARAITIRHLLTHTAGLPDYEDLMGNAWTPLHQIQDSEVLQLLEHAPNPKFVPGTSWSYSNSAYVLLGLIVSKVSGRPFGDFLHDRIFAPLHMDRSLVFVNGKNSVPDRAFGHRKDKREFIEADQSSTSATQGDGGIYSNLEDLSKWDEALTRYAVLPQKEMEIALTPVRLKDGSQPHWPSSPGEDNLDPGNPVSYGFGWFLDPYRGNRRMWHSGTTTGFRTIIDRFPAAHLTVIVLSNRTDLDPAGLALKTADLFLNK